VEDKDRRHTEIWMAPADGSAPAFRYTSPSTEASSPRWSPDGSLLAFSSKREGSDDDIWFLRTSAPGGEAFQIKGVHAMPVFSADGRWLAYAWRGDEPDSMKKETWRTRVSPSAITHGPDPKRFDGRVYTSIPVVADERGYLPPRETRRPSHLYLVPLAGGTPRQLTSGELSQTSPSPTARHERSGPGSLKAALPPGPPMARRSRSCARRAVAWRTTSASFPRPAEPHET